MRKVNSGLWIKRSPQDAMMKFGRGLGLEELARGGIRLSCVGPMVKEDVTVKGHPADKYALWVCRRRGWPTHGECACGKEWHCDLS